MSNLKINLSEKEINYIDKGIGTLTKQHTESGRNYQVKISSFKPPIVNEAFMAINIRELN